MVFENASHARRGKIYRSSPGDNNGADGRNVSECSGSACHGGFGPGQLGSSCHVEEDAENVESARVLHQRQGSDDGCKLAPRNPAICKNHHQRRSGGVDSGKRLTKEMKTYGLDFDVFLVEGEQEGDPDTGLRI